MKGYAPLVITRGPCDLGTTETTTRLDLDPLRPGPHRRLYGGLQRTAERDTLCQLVRDSVGNQLRIQLRTLDRLDIDRDLALREKGELITELVDLRALLTNHAPGTCRLDRDHDLLRLTIDLDIRNRGVTQPPTQEIGRAHV